MEKFCIDGKEKMPTRDLGQKGSLLILVLWAMAFLGVLTVLSGVMVRQQILLLGKIEKRSELYDIVSAAPAIVQDYLATQEGSDIFTPEDIIKGIAEKGDELNSPVKFGKGYFTWGEFDGGDVEKWDRRYGLVDETGKINLNVSGGDVIKEILKIAGGMDEITAEKITQNILDWRDANDTPRSGDGMYGEKDLYSRKGYSYSPRNKPFICLEEILLVDGMTPDIFLRIKDHVTVFGSGKVNVNTASGEVLQALGASKGLAGKIITSREKTLTSGWQEEKNIFRSKSDLLRVVSLEKSDGSSDEEIREVDNLLLGGGIGTKLEVLSVMCTGRHSRDTSEGRILCVFDSMGRVLYWSYALSGRNN
jgi:hypothetical protein